MAVLLLYSHLRWGWRVTIKLWKETPLKMGQEDFFNNLQNICELLETKQNINITCPEILFTESQLIHVPENIMNGVQENRFLKYP